MRTGTPTADALRDSDASWPVLKRLSWLWSVITGTGRRQAQRQFRARWCSIRFDETAIDIKVQERPVWKNRVVWDDITAVGLEPGGMLGPGLYLFLDRDPAAVPGLVWASLDGTGGPELHEEGELAAQA